MGILVFDIGGSFIKSAHSDRTGKLILNEPIKTPLDKDQFINVIKDIIDKNRKNIEGAVFALPGGYNFKKRCIYAPNLQAINGCDIVTELESLSGMDILIENDANLAALGEYIFAEYKEITDMVFITLGTGVGGGFICDGHLFSSNRFTSFEVGHISVRRDGRQCECGRQGCLDEHCTIGGLLKNYEELGGNLNICNSPIELGKLAKSGDSTALKAFDIYAIDLGHGLADVGNLCCPEKIKLGGGLSELSEFFLPKCIEVFEKELFPLYKGNIKVEVAGLKNNAGLAGAAAYFYGL